MIHFYQALNQLSKLSKLNLIFSTYNQYEDAIQLDGNISEEVSKRLTHLTYSIQGNMRVQSIAGFMNFAKFLQKAPNIKYLDFDCLGNNV